MNPAHRSARFLCAVGAEEIPVRRFAIVTACNPGDRSLPDSNNQAADEALTGELDRLGCFRFRVVGASPDLAHQEPGWGVAMDSSEAAVTLGRRWGQMAIYWVDHDALSLVACEDGRSEDLGRWSARTLFRQAMGPWHVDSGAVIAVRQKCQK